MCRWACQGCRSPKPPAGGRRTAAAAARSSRTRPGGVQVFADDRAERMVAGHSLGRAVTGVNCSSSPAIRCCPVNVTRVMPFAGNATATVVVTPSCRTVTCRPMRNRPSGSASSRQVCSSVSKTCALPGRHRLVGERADWTPSSATQPAGAARIQPSRFAPYGWRSLPSSRCVLFAAGRRSQVDRSPRPWSPSPGRRSCTCAVRRAERDSHPGRRRRATR
jgi:hypothetical protein